MIDPPHPPQIERLLELVSPRTGIVRNLERVVRGADEPMPPVLYAATISNYDFKRVPAIERGAAGKGLTASAAIGGAIGEAVERYCASHVDGLKMQRTSLRDAPTGALLPQDLGLYSKRQYARAGFPFIPPVPEMAIDWMRATEILGAHGHTQPTWVPAVAVYLHGNNVMPGDALFMSNSSGLAAGPDLDSAVRGGLCELIERDSFVVTWMNRLEPTRIRVDEPSGGLLGIVEHYHRFGVDLQLYALASDIEIPVVLALEGSGRGHWPWLPSRRHPGGLAGGIEVCQVRPSQVHHRRYPRRLTAEDVHSIEDHSAYFSQHEVLHELDFVRHTPRHVALSALPRWAGGSAADDVATCVTALQRIGCRVFMVDVTTPDLLPYPIRVVRTVATGLQPIHFGYGMARLGGTRLREAAERLRPGVSAPTEDELNPCPHPLA
jgi:ribosomal protein S12 methylthiotransferase accessory factor